MRPAGHLSVKFGRVTGALASDINGLRGSVLCDGIPIVGHERVFWIVDNGSSHRGPRAVQRLRHNYPNLVLVQGPVHASWINQIEIFSPSSNARS